MICAIQRAWLMNTHLSWGIVQPEEMVLVYMKWERLVNVVMETLTGSVNSVKSVCYEDTHFHLSCSNVTWPRGMGRHRSMWWDRSVWWDRSMWWDRRESLSVSNMPWICPKTAVWVYVAMRNCSMLYLFKNRCSYQLHVPDHVNLTSWFQRQQRVVKTFTDPPDRRTTKANS